MSPAAAELRTEQPMQFKQYSPAEPAQALAQPMTLEAKLQQTAALQTEPNGVLMELDWAAELRAAPGVEPVMTAGALLSPDSTMGEDHLFSALLRHGMAADLTCLFDKPRREVHSLVALSRGVCGHPGIVHGGMSATIMDETLGALVYMLKREGDFGAGPAFTARLEVDYKKPLPAPCSVCCTARLLSVEGRKAWAAVELAEKPGGVVYAAGKALFVTPRQQPQELPSSQVDKQSEVSVAVAESGGM